MEPALYLFALMCHLLKTLPTGDARQFLAQGVRPWLWAATALCPLHLGHFAFIPRPGASLAAGKGHDQQIILRQPAVGQSLQAIPGHILHIILLNSNGVDAKKITISAGIERLVLIYKISEILLYARVWWDQRDCMVMKPIIDSLIPVGVLSSFVYGQVRAHDPQRLATGRNLIGMPEMTRQQLAVGSLDFFSHKLRLGRLTTWQRIKFECQQIGREAHFKAVPGKVTVCRNNVLR